MPLLSIIIPTYNRKSLIGYTLDSLASDKHPGVDLEIIVVDDHSTDGTIGYLNEKYPHVKTLVNTGKGAPFARNMGVANSKGKYINFLDSDDLIGEHYFFEKIKFLETNPGLDAAYGRFECFRSSGNFSIEQIIFKIKYPVIPECTSARQHLCNYLAGFYMPPNAVIWTRRFLEKLGPHDTNLSINQDVDYFIRANIAGLKISGIGDDTFAFIRSHELDTRVGSTNNSEQKFLEILNLRKKIFELLKTNNLAGEDTLKSLSTFLFYKWQETRHTLPQVAAAYLEFAKQVYWPVPIKGGLLLRVLCSVFGPVNAVKIKTLLRGGK